MKLQKLDAEFSVCKVKAVPSEIFECDFYFIGKTDEELSLVCPSKAVPEEAEDREDGWKAFRICGILDFSLTGILSGISSVLAEHEIGIFALSTFNTDYILVKSENFIRAASALEKAGYTIL